MGTHSLKLAALTVSAILAANSTETVAGPVLQKIASSGVITLAHRESSAPLSYLDANKQPIGYSLDVCSKIVAAIKSHLELSTLKVEYMPVNPKTRIEAITGGKADLECGSTTNNADRRQKVSFAIPHYITGIRYLVPVKSPVRELADFNKKTLVSTKDTPAFKMVNDANNDRLMGIKVESVPDHAAALEKVISGAADGFAMDEVLLAGLKAGSAKDAELKITGRYLAIEPISIMLSKDDPELLDVANKEIKRLIKAREIYPIYDKWFKEKIPPKMVALNMPIPYLLADLWRYPTHKIGIDQL